MKQIAKLITDSVELNPTLVVWLVDRTQSAKPIVQELTAAAANFYESPEVAEWSAQSAHPLVSAVVTFDQSVQFVVEQPTHEPDKISSALTSLKQGPGGKEMPFTAIKQALEKYLPHRATDQRDLLMILVTDEAGDDANVAEEVLEPLRRQAIPLYVIGRAAPWGQVNPFAKDPIAAVPTKDDTVPAVGPESVQSERVDISPWSAPANASSELVDSGFGPFALERVCRATRGQFFSLRPPATKTTPKGPKRWPTGEELRFEPSAVTKYAPDYVSADEYKKRLAGNMAAAALSEAARLPKLTLEGTPGTRFPKDVEAKMAQKMTAAQQFAARNLPPIERLHDLLEKGEKDRSKLTSPRWQAQYDLAFGRSLAFKARLDGYNSMIAALKRGKTFQNAESKAWLLESADNFETESTIKKMADKAKTYLTRVIQEHPGTPWSKMAEQELKTPLGWTWKEAK